MVNIVRNDVISDFSSTGEDQAGYPTAEEGEHPDGHQDWSRGTHAAPGKAEGQDEPEQADPHRTAGYVRLQAVLINRIWSTSSSTDDNRIR